MRVSTRFGLAVVLCATITWLASPQTGYSAGVNYLPPDTELVVLVHIKQIRQAAIVKLEPGALLWIRSALLAWSATQPAVKCLLEAGFDPLQDLHRITLAAPRGKDLDASLVILEGHFAAANLTSRL